MDPEYLVEEPITDFDMVNGNDMYGEEQVMEGEKTSLYVNLWKVRIFFELRNNIKYVIALLNM